MKFHIFSYSVKRIIYTLSNFLRFCFDNYVSSNRWGFVFFNKVSVSFFKLKIFSKMKFNFSNNNFMFIPDQLAPTIKRALKERARRKARSIAYGVYNSVNRFLFPRIRKSRHTIKRNRIANSKKV